MSAESAKEYNIKKNGAYGLVTHDIRCMASERSMKSMLAEGYALYVDGKKVGKEEAIAISRERDKLVNKPEGKKK